MFVEKHQLKIRTDTTVAFVSYSHSNDVIMKVENTNEQNMYLAPSIGVLDICLEGPLCMSVKDDHEDLGWGGDFE